MRKQGLHWGSRLQGTWWGADTWQGANTWHQVTCPPPVGWTQVAVVKVNSRRMERRAGVARQRRVGSARHLVGTWGASCGCFALARKARRSLPRRTVPKSFLALRPSPLAWR